MIIEKKKQTKQVKQTNQVDHNSYNNQMIIFHQNYKNQEW